MEQQQLLLEIKGMYKQFPGVKALDNVSLTLKKGEVLGLVGENGAGKSTLIKIINGVYNRDEGEILIEGKAVEMHNPYEAKMVHKIAYVSQENTLCSNITVAENMVLGNWGKRGIFVNWKKNNEFAKKALADLGLKINPNKLLSQLSPSDRQLVEIARAISMDSKILLLDEPTSWLSESEKKYLFERVEFLKTKGIGIIFISHFLEEVLLICDRIQVLREGKNVGAYNKEDLTKKDLIEKMLGRKQREVTEDDSAERVKEKVALKVVGMSKAGILDKVSFELHEGEILGITGLLGSGKSELGRMIYGADAPDEGEIYVNGVKQNNMNPKKSIKLNIGYITKDRKEEGIIPLLSISKNITLANLKSVLAKIRLMNLHREKETAKKMIKMMDIRPNNPEHIVVNLSGGNQQKVIISKWMYANSKILIVDEPTRGIDIGAKFEIYNLLRNQAKEGKSIVFISSELEEILSVCDRILTIKNGEITGEYLHGEIKDEHGLLAILTA